MYTNINNYIIGCIVIRNGILIPTLKFPFMVHHNKYKHKPAIIAVDKKLTLKFSNPKRILFKNVDNGKPLGVITLNSNLKI
jgi:hypothetical protein